MNKCEVFLHIVQRSHRYTRATGGQLFYHLERKEFWLYFADHTHNFSKGTKIFTHINFSSLGAWRGACELLTSHWFPTPALEHSHRVTVWSLVFISFTTSSTPLRQLRKLRTLQIYNNYREYIVQILYHSYIKSTQLIGRLNCIIFTTNFSVWEYKSY